MFAGNPHSPCAHSPSQTPHLSASAMPSPSAGTAGNHGTKPSSSSATSNPKPRNHDPSHPKTHRMHVGHAGYHLLRGGHHRQHTSLSRCRFPHCRHGTLLDHLASPHIRRHPPTRKREALSSV